MLIHNYDSITGQYIMSGLADPDPRNPDRWMVPAFSTQIPLPDRPRLTWPFFVNGAWELRPDHRGLMLYRRDSGENAEILVAGITPEEAGLTATPRPSDEYHWLDGEWVINPEIIAQRERSAAMAEFDLRMGAAKSRTTGKADALAADLLDAAGVAIFKAWAAYQIALVAVVESDSFPAARQWPPEPDEVELASQAYANEAAKKVETEAAAAEIATKNDAQHAAAEALSTDDAGAQSEIPDSTP